MALLAARAKRAMFEYTPLRPIPVESERVYRFIPRGPLLDLFMLDMRSYRGANSENRQTQLTDEARILGAEQVQWLKQRLLASRATWKVIAADMPLGLVVYHDAARKWGSEAVAQGDGPALGRELEIADILRFIKHNDVRNVVWITADVHYCATHLYDPARAQFTDFNPFYEFVSGPLHAGGFGPNELDNTFGPRVVFTRNPGGRVNSPPTENGLYFGHVRIDGRTRAMTVTHHDVTGAALERRELPAPALSAGASRNFHRDVIPSQRRAATVAAVMRSIVSPVIRLDRVTKSFQGRRALDDVSAAIEPGEFVAVIGKSGAGKTTLLRCLSRATPVTRGAIRFDRRDLAGAAAARRSAPTARASG